MRCHIEKIEGVGKVLIPGCMAVAVSGDIERCTCHPTTIRQFETPKYKEHVKELEKTIRSLEKENEYYRVLLIKKNQTITMYYNSDYMHCSQERCYQKNKCWRYWFGQESARRKIQYVPFFMPDENEDLTNCIYFENKKEHERT